MNQHPAFYRLDALLPPNQQCQSTEVRYLQAMLIQMYVTNSEKH